MAVLPCPLHLGYHVFISGFDYHAWSPPRYNFRLRLMFPFDYLYRFHHDSMIGPALLYPGFLHGPWAYEPHAQGRTLRFASFCIGFGHPFALISGSAPFLCVSLGLCFASFSCICLGISFVFTSDFASFLDACVGISRLQFGFFFRINLRRWFSYPFWPPFRLLISSSVLVLVPLSTVVSVYRPCRDV